MSEQPGRDRHWRQTLILLVATLAVVSFVRFASPVWFLYVALLALLAFRTHPPTLADEYDIGNGRRLVTAIVILIFVLSFMPFPITVN